MDSMLPNPTGHEALPSLQQPEHTSAPEQLRDAEPRPEVMASGPERLQSANHAVAQAVASSTVVVQQPTLTAPPATDSPSLGSGPAVADDVPVIEKEWVVLAKEIIMKTRQDPREQSSQLEAVKLDYVRKRFGKELKKTDGT